jgi:hypothetical protein
MGLEPTITGITIRVSTAQIRPDGGCSAVAVDEIFLDEPGMEKLHNIMIILCNIAYLGEMRRI